MLHRPLIALLLSLCLIWQVAFVSQGGALSGGAAPEHGSMHVFDQSHHHHDDGGFHEDESPEAAQHVQSDGLMQVTAVFAAPPSLSARAPWLLTCRLAVEQAMPSPYLEGPERPPRLIA